MALTSSDPTEYVYLIGSKDSPVVKIGRSIDVPARLIAIQNMSPLKLVVLWQTEGGAELESALHRWFRAQREHGEWFNFPDGDAPAQVAQAAAEIANRNAPPPIPGLSPVGWESPLHEQVVDKLRQLIRAGELRPGGQVPTEDMLIEQCNVSRSTVRKALRSLEQEGLIHSHGGRNGRTVRQPRKLTRYRCSTVNEDLWDIDNETETVEPPASVAALLELEPGELVAVRREMRIVDGEPHNASDTYCRLDIAGSAPVYYADILAWRVPTPEESRRLNIPTGVAVVIQSRICHTQEGPARVTVTTWRGDRAGLVYEVPA